MKAQHHYICDTCRALIEAPEQGCVEWIDPPDGPAHSFRICHNNPECKAHHQSPDGASMFLNRCIGENASSFMLSFIQGGGEYEGFFGPVNTRDMYEFAELMRRLLVPYYEEARLGFEAAKADAFVSEPDHIHHLWPDDLREIVARYTNSSM